MKRSPFGKLPSGEAIEEFTLSSPSGATLSFLSYGGIVRTLLVPDRDGRMADVVLGLSTLQEYVAGHPFFGAITGRVAGRIPHGRFSVGGQTYDVVCNDGPNHLHGGLQALDKKVWEVSDPGPLEGVDRACLRYFSPDGEEGYPGNVHVEIIYSLTAQNRFIIETRVETDRTTPINLTHHSYFHLGGEGNGDISDHWLTVHAEEYFPVNEYLTTLDRVASIDGQPGDFRKPRRMGDAIPQLFLHHGDVYRLPPTQPGVERPAARLSHPESGRVLEVSTTDACLQMYTGMSLDGAHRGKTGNPYPAFSGICLECQDYPNAVNRPDLGNILVHPGQPKTHTTTYSFSVE